MPEVNAETIEHDLALLEDRITRAGNQHMLDASVNRGELTRRRHDRTRLLALLEAHMIMTGVDQVSERDPSDTGAKDHAKNVFGIFIYDV